MFKDVELHEQFDVTVVDPRLFGLVCALANYVHVRFGKNLVLTSLVRAADSGPHGQGRAADIRCHFGYFTPEELDDIKAWTRRHFPRSDQRALETNATSGREWSGPIRHHGDGPNEHLHVCVEPAKKSFT